MRSSATATFSMILFLFGALSSGCADPAESESPAGVTEAVGPLVIEGSGSSLQVEAPAGDFNMFSIYASYDTGSCGLSQPVYGITGPSGVRIEDCPDCLLPGSVHVGQAIPGFDSFACLPGSQTCELTEDVSGLTFADLNYETYLCGEIVMPTSFTVEYQHLDTTEPEAPRTWVTVSAALSIDASGNAVVVSDWESCTIDANSDSCD